jgi:hypothetical protein
VVFELIHHSRPQDGGGRLGNYFVLSDPESESVFCSLAASRPDAELSKERYVLKITPRSDHGG